MLDVAEVKKNAFGTNNNNMKATKLAKILENYTESEELMNLIKNKIQEIGWLEFTKIVFIRRGVNRTQHYPV